MDDFEKLIKHPDHKVQLKGLTFLVKDGVFTPDPEISHSSSMTLDNLPDVKEKDVLDMGTGCGVIAVYCSKLGARKVVAVDNNKLAIENTSENVKNLKIENIGLVESDLFEKVEGAFDYIFANLPVCDDIWEGREEPLKIIRRFFENARKYLKEEGKIFLSWLSKSDVQQVRDILESLNYKYKEKSLNKFGFTWYSFEIN